MTQLGTAKDAWVSVVDPDLNFTNPQASYGVPDASVARTLDFTVHGSWTLDNPEIGTSILASNGATSSLRVATQHGFAEHARLIISPDAASWANPGSDWNDSAIWGGNWSGTTPANALVTDIANLGAATVQAVLGSALGDGTTLSGSGKLPLGAGGIPTTGSGITIGEIAVNGTSNRIFGRPGLPALPPASRTTAASASGAVRWPPWDRMPRGSRTARRR